MDNQMEQAGPSRPLDHLARPSRQLDFPDLRVFPYFLPEQKLKCIPKIIQLIDEASKDISVHAYRFTSKPIANALINAKKRGIHVTVYVDKDAETEEGNVINYLEDNGIKPKVDQGEGRAHNKVILIDDDITITGSYNWADMENYRYSDVVIFIKDTDKCVNDKYRQCLGDILEGSFKRKSGDSYKGDRKNDNKRHKKMPLPMNEAASPASLFGSNIYNTRPQKTLLPMDETTRNPSFISSIINWLQNTRPPMDETTRIPSHNNRNKCCAYSLYGDDNNTSQDDEGFEKVTSKKKNKNKSENYVEINVCFPGYDNQNCIQQIVDYFQNAKAAIYIQTCSLTHDSISRELINAYRRRIDIKVLADKKACEGMGEKISDLKKEGITVKVDTTCPYDGKAHSKIIIIDDYLVLAGSFNLTKSAQNRNLENLLSINNRIVNVMFRVDFFKKWDKAE